MKLKCAHIICIQCAFLWLNSKGNEFSVINVIIFDFKENRRPVRPADFHIENKTFKKYIFTCSLQRFINLISFSSYNLYDINYNFSLFKLYDNGIFSIYIPDVQNQCPTNSFGRPFKRRSNNMWRIGARFYMIHKFCRFLVISLYSYKNI